MFQNQENQLLLESIVQTKKWTSVPSEEAFYQVLEEMEQYSDTEYLPLLQALREECQFLTWELLSPLIAACL